MTQEWLLERESKSSSGQDRDFAWGDPSAPPTAYEVQMSIAISLKRIADVLESVTSGADSQIKEINIRANCDVRTQ